MFSLAWRCSSLTQAFALSSDDCGKERSLTGSNGRGCWDTHGLSDVVNNDGAVGIAVVHGSQRLVAFLACGIPYLKLDGSVVVEGDGLGQESGADGRLAVVVELVLRRESALGGRALGRACGAP